MTKENSDFSECEELYASASMIENITKPSNEEIEDAALTFFDAAQCFDKNGDHELGNINSGQTMKEIWQGASYTNFRKDLINNRESIDICRNCNQGLGSFIFNWNTRKQKKQTPESKSIFPILNQ